MSNLQKYTLANGVRVLVEPVTHVKSAAIGLWCKTGSRHENDDEAGITHLIEHMLFKGTKRRTAKEIAEAIEGRGGSLNAFTDKESTCYYCRVLSDDVDNGIDVLTDMMRDSLLDPEELEREEQVVIEEIKRSEDEPSDHVHELHLSYRWGDHPLGKPIIGTRESVGGFKRENLSTYMDRRYRGDNVLLSVAGNVDAEAVRALAEKLLGDLPAGGGETEVPRPAGQSSKHEVSKDVEQVHFCIGTDGCSLYDDELYTITVLDAALGGSMSSRLFQEIREKRGLPMPSAATPSIHRQAVRTRCTAEHPKNLPLVQELVRQEMDKVMADGFDAEELERTKRHPCGSIVLALKG
ncbi:MAG: pitrilysin family protein [Fimbriimonadales bacterium]